MKAMADRSAGLKRQLLATARATICHFEMNAAGETVGLAVSGGADSVGLLRLFLELRDELGISLCVVHLNHKLRGNDSDSDQKFVAMLASQFDLKFFTASVNCAADARRNHLNLEDAGRRARYDFFSSLIAEHHCDKVATAHTADDQAETVLARLLRGSSPRGLVGIRPVNGNFIRPLIDLHRQDLRSYLKTLRQSWREDGTNLDQDRLRARLRHSLIPLLQRDYNPQIVGILNGLASQASLDENFWDSLIERLLENSLHRESAVWSISLDDLLSPKLLQTPESSRSDPPPSEALSKRLILAILNKLASQTAATRFSLNSNSKTRARFDSKHIDQVLRLAQALQSGRQIELPRKIRVTKSFDRLEFAGPATQQPKGTIQSSPASYTYEYRVELRPETSATIDVPELGSRFSLKLIDWPAGGRETSDCEVLDADLLRHPLVLRNWRPGDVYQPQNQHHTKKLKSYFASRRISLRNRPSWPVLLSGSDIAWTRGFVAANFRMTKASKRGLTISEEKNGSNPPEIFEGKALHPRSPAGSSHFQRLRRPQSRRSRSR
jgi:tRNA(Ile)-lysidine synthase